MKVLVADDNVKIRDHLKALLEQEGFEVVTAENGKIALETYQNDNPDFICLDIRMPDLSGYDVCKTIRQENTNIPIIFISSKSDPIDKVLGLELGADDYIAKPFEIREVIARMRAVARRCLQADDKVKSDFFTMQDLEVYPKKLQAKRGDTVIDLSLRECKILTLLYDNKNEIVDRDTLLDHAWGAHIMPESRTVDWHILQLRKSVELDPKNPTIIQTVRGVGYKFVE